MEARNFKIIILLCFICDIFFAYSQEKITKLEINGHVSLSFSHENERYFPTRITFENDSIDCRIITSCIEKTRILKNYSLNPKEYVLSNCENFLEEDSINSLEKTFALKRGTNNGGYVTITSPYIYHNRVGDSLKIIFELYGSFIYIENTNLYDSTNPEELLILDKIFWIKESNSEFLESKKYFKSDISNIIYPVSEY